MTSLQAALKYASRGWAVVPVHSIQDNGACSCGAIEDYTIEPKHAMGKHPYTGVTGHREASTDPAKIEHWWSMWPDANVAIATGLKSNLIVLDIDKKNGGLGSFSYMKHMYGDLPRSTPMVHSGGGGLHYYFRHPGYEVRGRRGMFSGIDVFADGGRIVAPPSLHKSKNNYVWDRDASDLLEPAPIPSWLLGLIMQKQSKRKHL